MKHADEVQHQHVLVITPSFLVPSSYGIPYLPNYTSYHITPSRISYPLSVKCRLASCFYHCICTA